MQLAGSAGSSATSIQNPNRLRFTIACVSSLQRAPRRTTGLLARAARIKARLVRLFEPGRTTVASVRRLGGTISMRSGSLVRELCVARAPLPQRVIRIVLIACPHLSGLTPGADDIRAGRHVSRGPISEVTDTKLRRRQRQRSIRQTSNATYGCERDGM